MTRSMLIGRFYFKKTTEGNLIGEYSHRELNCTRSFAEAASRVGKGTEWVGDYKTCWVEPPDLEFGQALLKITKKRGAVNLFRLRWYGEDGSELFTGEAMLSDDLLIGDYTGV